MTQVISKLDKCEVLGQFEIVQFQKISILPLQKGLEFPGGRGFCKAKKFKEM